MANAGGEHISLKDWIDSELALRDKAIDVARVEVNRRLEAMNALREQIAAERAEYATREDLDRLDEAINMVVADHVKRDEMSLVRGTIDQMQGRRTLAVALAGVFVTLLIAAFSYIIASVPTHDQIATQIREDAPWIMDKPEVLHRIEKLETQVAVNTAHLQRIDNLNAFFCKTRSAKGLPGCSP